MFDKYVNIFGKINKITNTDFVDMPFLRKIEPIPLTEEWLLKFGFEKNKNSDLYFRLNNYEYFIENGIIDNGYSRMNEISVKYVHQLQNLYFALTGKELEIIETK